MQWQQLCRQQNERVGGQGTRDSGSGVWVGYYGVFQGQEAEEGRRGVKVAKAVKVGAAERM